MKSSDDRSDALLPPSGDRAAGVLSATAIAAKVDAPPAAEQIRKSEGEARRGLVALHEIVDLIPIGIKVQAPDGRLLLVNEAAASLTVAALIRSNDTPSSALDTAQSRVQLASQNATASVTREERIEGPGGERFFLTTRMPILVRNELLLLSTFVDITDRKRIEDGLARRAYYDELTGLPNRCLIQEQIESNLGDTQSRFALAFLDIDNFKHINDYYGHAIGDSLLVQMSQRIVKAIRHFDMVARISGDEYLLLINRIEEEEEVATIINRIIDCTKQPFVIDGFEIFSSTSIGVSLYPEHGLDYQTLRNNADSAMYQVKRSVKGGAALFDPKIDQLASARVQAEQRLRLAIRDRRFRCAFQPKVDITTEEVVGVEALIRLLDENGDIQSPSSFVDLAVELGLIDDLTHLAVSQIANSIDLINDAFGSETTISINVAAKQASNVDFMHSFIEILKATNFAERFIAEVTEDAFVAKSLFQAQVLPMLRENGVRVSIDDFGTGYSSLSALADVTADEIKIDRSFITGIHERKRNQSILKAIESLSAALGMTVIAEGVETFEELTYLRAATRIRYAQGFYFARPLFLEEFAPAKRVGFASRSAPRSRESQDKRRGNWRSR